MRPSQLVAAAKARWEKRAKRRSRIAQQFMRPAGLDLGSAPTGDE